MNDLLENWLNYKPLSKYEESLLSDKRTYKIIEEDDLEYKNYQSEFFNKMPLCNISSDNYSIRFDESATNIIDKLFEKYVDDETLVISSSQEHPSVEKNLEKCKNVYKIDLNKDFNLHHFINDYSNDLLNIQNISKNFKKVFIYIIGVQLASGVITPSSLYLRIQKILSSKNIKYITVIDDVHGMFFAPRDYTIFDYIIGTAHALIEEFDLGIVITKHSNIGYKSITALKDYIERLSVIFNRYDKLMLFKMVLNHTFEKYLISEKFSCFNDNVIPHIYTLQSFEIPFNQKMFDTLEKYAILVEGCNEKNWIGFRIRFSQIIKNPPRFVEGLKEIEKYIQIHNLIKGE